MRFKGIDDVENPKDDSHAEMATINTVFSFPIKVEKSYCPQAAATEQV